MTLPDAPTRGRSLQSTITSDGRVRLSLEERSLPELGDGQVVVAVEASPINPSDLGVLLGPVRPDGLTRDGDDLVGSGPAELLPRVRDRLAKSLPVGNECAGTGVAVVPGPVGRHGPLFGGPIGAAVLRHGRRWAAVGPHPPCDAARPAATCVLHALRLDDLQAGLHLRLAGLLAHRHRP